ncbi:membrane associated rhomboid family serine protease [Prosthecobacter fusiformis]|uniref:Membrane associated rhomboid family serine protease n=1 Tax=Prosthecobacter fusiformis TaxID=48464 RepID=A0A4R7RL47_9BACT|nr:rhomboid family intramembrane serine protease [Prosthecobacter fusiformis]TDU66061.1 membrane associated rhomboid family serine protease [Prosthecobacter fusiformis]
MSWLPESKDHLPLTWWKGNPVYLSAVLAIGGVVSMILTSILMAAAPGSLDYLIFQFSSLMKGWVWTPFTYILVNPPSLWLVVGCFMLWRFGEAVERHLGRSSFVRLLVILLLVSPLLVSLAAFLGAQRGCMGMTEWEFGVFIAFATLYPRAQVSLIFFTLEVWILAAVFVGISALSALAMRDWTSLMILFGQVGTAIAYIRYEQGALTLPTIPTFKAKAPAKPQAVSRPRSTTAPASPAAPKVKKNSPVVDDILDKISREGMHSLTPDERRVLDQASEDLQKRGL